MVGEYSVPVKAAASRSEIPMIARGLRCCLRFNTRVIVAKRVKATPRPRSPDRERE